MPYRPRFTIYTPTRRLRWPKAWTPMELHEARDGKMRSTQRARDYGWWQKQGRQYLKPVHTGAYGTWRLIRVLKGHGRRILWN